MMGHHSHASDIRDCAFPLADIILLLPSPLYTSMKQVTMLERPAWQATGGTLGPSAGERVKPTIHGGLKPARSHIRELGSRSSVNPSDDCSPG